VYEAEAEQSGSQHRPQGERTYSDGQKTQTSKKAEGCGTANGAAARIGGNCRAGSRNERKPRVADGRIPLDRSINQTNRAHGKKKKMTEAEECCTKKNTVVRIGPQLLRCFRVEREISATVDGVMS
jgi:hypothetical protein